MVKQPSDRAGFKFLAEGHDFSIPPNGIYPWHNNLQKCKPSGKDRDDRGVLSKNKFDPLNIEIKYPGTAIQLLESKENSTLVAAAAALSKFGSKSSENLGVLFDLNIVTSILPLIRHEEVFIRRFATKLLAEMAALPNVRNFLAQSDFYIPHFTSVLLTDSDVFIHEFVTLILAEISKDFFGVAQLLSQCNNFDFLFQRIGSSDPDVKKNSIEIISNLLRDPLGAQEIINSKGFSFPLIYDLLKQPYPVIQLLTLDVINSLVARNRDENIQELFRASRGPQTLLDILDNEETKDLHQKILVILSLACDNLKTAEILCNSGGIQKIFKYMESCDKKLTLDVLNVVVRLANCADGKKELYKRGVVEYLTKLLRESSNPEAAGVSFYGISKMAQYGPAAEEIASANPIPSILGFITNENVKQSSKDLATYCLAELLASDVRNCANLLDIKGQSYLVRMIKQPVEKVPIETQITALQCLTAIGGYPEFREQIIDRDLIDALCAPFEFQNSASLAEFKVACCNALSMFCIEQTARDVFLQLEGQKKLYRLLLDSESVPVRDAAARLISQLSSDEAVAPSLILAGCLEYMIRVRSTSKVVSSWEMSIKALFNSYLPAKFAFTGRLSLHDVTKNGFYVVQRNTRPFSTLEQLFTPNVSPMQTIYICNLAQPQLSLDSSSATEDNLSDKNGAAKTATKESTFSIYDEDVTKAVTAEPHEKLRPDPYLCDLLKLFKCKLIAKEPKDAYEQEIPGLVNIRYIKSRANMLGEFVARQMSGPDPTTSCIDHQLELHLNEIKQDLGTNVIPLGQLRVGSYLERALLFKVIADRICLPAALVRGDYGKAWIEIALPEMEESLVAPGTQTIETGIPSTRYSKSSVKSLSGGRQSWQESSKRIPIDEPTSSILPTKLLRPNYVVDLMHRPGELIPLGTKRADDYVASASS